MANIESIKGILAPCDILGVNHLTADKIHEAANAHDLYEVIKPDSAWNRGVIAINTHLADADQLTVMELVDRLTDFLHTKGIEELDLDGALKVAVDAEPYEFKIVVRLGKVTYQPV